jgi:hypothetical protein
LCAVSNSKSQQQGGYGWNCYHNGVFYTMVGGNMTCPNPDTYLNSMQSSQTHYANNNQNPSNEANSARIKNGGSLLKHDPNDHNCVITRLPNSNY